MVSWLVTLGKCPSCTTILSIHGTLRPTHAHTHTLNIPYFFEFMSMSDLPADVKRASFGLVFPTQYPNPRPCSPMSQSTSQPFCIYLTGSDVSVQSGGMTRHEYIHPPSPTPRSCSPPSHTHTHTHTHTPSIKGDCMGRHEYVQVGWNGSEWISLNPTVLDKTASCAPTSVPTSYQLGVRFLLIIYFSC